MVVSTYGSSSVMEMYVGRLPTCFIVTNWPTAPAHHSTYGREFDAPEYWELPQRTALREVVSPGDWPTATSNAPRNASYAGLSMRFQIATYPIGVFAGTRTDSQLPTPYCEAQSVPLSPSMHFCALKRSAYVELSTALRRVAIDSELSAGTGGAGAGGGGCGGGGRGIGGGRSRLMDT